MTPLDLLTAFQRANDNTRLHQVNARVKYPGICRAAADLGVSRIHLYFVVTGARRSPRIEASPWYQAVTRKEA